MVHTAAKAAMDYALKAGVAKDVAEKISEAATEAAIALLDPTGASSLAKDGEDALPTAERIENSLARAVKQNAVRTMNIFRDCACSAPSRPRARLSNSCAAAAGLPACLAGSWTQPHTQHTRVRTHTLGAQIRTTPSIWTRTPLAEYVALAACSCLGLYRVYLLFDKRKHIDCRSSR